MQQFGVRPSVPSIDNSRCAQARGWFAAERGRLRRYRSIADTRRTRSAANAGSVMLTAEGRGSTQTFYLRNAVRQNWTCLIHSLQSVVTK